MVEFLTTWRVPGTSKYTNLGEVIDRTLWALVLCIVLTYGMLSFQEKSVTTRVWDGPAQMSA